MLHNMYCPKGKMGVVNRFKTSTHSSLHTYTLTHSTLLVPPPPAHHPPALSITAFNLETSIVCLCIHPLPVLALLIGLEQSSQNTDITNYWL